MRESTLRNFITNNLNDNNKWGNAITYDDEWFEKYRNVRIVFQRRHSELYARLLRFCADNGGIIIKTHPGTLETTVRVEMD